MNSASSRGRAAPTWLADVARALVLGVLLFEAATHARPYLLAVVGVLAAFSLLCLVALALLPLLLLVGWTVERLCARMGIRLPDPGRIRGTFHVRVVRPLLHG